MPHIWGEGSSYLIWLLLEAGEAQGQNRTGPGSMTHGLVTFLDAPEELGLGMAVAKLVSQRTQTTESWDALP